MLSIGEKRRYPRNFSAYALSLIKKRMVLFFIPVVQREPFWAVARRKFFWVASRTISNAFQFLFLKFLFRFHAIMINLRKASFDDAGLPPIEDLYRLPQKSKHKPVLSFAT